MTNKEKTELFNSVTVGDILDWMDGYVVTVKCTEKNMDSIDGRYVVDKSVHYVRFDKSRYDGVCLSNARWLDSNKPFVTELATKGEQYIQPSKNLAKKVNSKDDAIRLIVNKYHKLLHFKIHGRSWDYVNITGLVTREENYCSHDYSGEMKELAHNINETKRVLEKMERKWNSMYKQQRIHNELYPNKQKD